LMSAATACWWWWLAPGLPFSSWFSSWWLVILLLGLLLVACPSPPGLALELHSTPWFCWMMFWWVCGAVKELLCSLWWWNAGRMRAACSGRANLLQLLALLAAVVLPTTPSQSCDWAACVLCACMPHCVDLIHLLNVLWNGLVPKCFVPQ
jgi:hypothetical protein